MEDTPNVRTTPFVMETRQLANECLERYQAMTGRILDSDTINADKEAWDLVRIGFSIAFRQAEQAGRYMLALHIGELLNEAKLAGCYLWLHGMAIDGKGLAEPGLQPIGRIIEPIVQRVTAQQSET
jgi:hypothetical protein